MTSALSTCAGIAVLLFLIREIFCQLFHPEGDDTLGRLIFRGGRALARRGGSTALVIAGPTCVILVIASWVLLAVVAWALVLLPHVPDAVVYGPGVEPGPPMIDALYLSLVGISTLGYGDIVPDASALRLLWPFEAIMGFGIITAGLTWGLSAFPPLGRQRGLARYAHLLLEEDRPSAERLDELARMVTSATIDIKLSPVTYYIVPSSDRESLPALAPRLWDAASSACSDPERSAAAHRLLRALDDMGDQLVSARLVPECRDEGRDRLIAYRDDAHPEARAPRRPREPRHSSRDSSGRAPSGGGRSATRS